MPFGGTTSSDDFETGTRAAAFGGTTTIVDFAIQARGTRMRDALDTWWKKAEGKACIDYGLHMIVTDLGASGLEDMDDMVREGVASFKLFMAYPNVLMVDDATIFKALSQTAKNGALVCMHAENGGVIDVIVAARSGGRQDGAGLSRADAAHARGSRSRASRDRAGRDRGRAGLHRAPVVGGRAEPGPRGPRSRRAGVCGDLSAVPAALDRRAGAAEFRRREVRVHAAAARERAICRSCGTG